jgi:hypothetical protein
VRVGGQCYWMGEGVNDGPALVTEIALLSDDLTKLPHLLSLSAGDAGHYAKPDLLPECAGDRSGACYSRHSLQEVARAAIAAAQERPQTPPDQECEEL